MAGHMLKVDLVHEYQQSSPQPYLSANSQLLFIEVSSWKLGKEKLAYIASFNLYVSPVVGFGIFHYKFPCLYPA